MSLYLPRTSAARKQKKNNTLIEALIACPSYPSELHKITKSYLYLISLQHIISRPEDSHHLIVLCIIFMFFTILVVKFFTFYILWSAALSSFIPGFTQAFRRLIPGVSQAYLPICTECPPGLLGLLPQYPVPHLTFFSSGTIHVLKQPCEW